MKFYNRQISRYSSAGIKLFLYVGVAVFSSMLTDFSHYSDDMRLEDIHDLRWVTIIVNAVVQGLIAWRAFIDGSVERIREEEHQEETLEHIESHLH